MRTMRRISPLLAEPLRSVLALSLIWIPLGLATAPQAFAQEAVQGTEPATVAAVPVVPQQVRFTGKLATRAGDTVEAVFRIYAAADGGEPLWTETQKVTIAEDSSYSVLLGSTDFKGLPQTVFAGGVARWLGVSVERGPETERVMLASVPYAMKSADAEALAGHAAADFVTQEQLSALALQSGQSASPTSALSPQASGPVTGTGTTGTIPLWTGAQTQGHSNMVQVGSEIGINETTPAAMLDVNGTEAVRGTLSLPTTATATASKGYSSQALQFVSSLWSTTSNAPVAENFTLTAIPIGNDTATPSASLLLNYQSGTSTPASILSIGSTGLISFASGQLFPGTITGALATSPLIAGVSGHNITMQLNETAMLATFNGTYAQLADSNSFTGSQSIKGGLSLTAGLTAQSSTVTGFSSAVQGFQSNGAITATPASAATSSAAQNSPLLELGASAYNSGSASAVAQTYAWQTQVSGNNTASPTAKLALLFGSGTGPAATGLSIASNGVINFSPSQTFPVSGSGGGTITGITTTSPLTGSGTTGSVALGFNTSALETTLNSVYPKLSATNTFTAGASFGGPIAAAATGSALTAITGTGTSGAAGFDGVSDSGNGANFSNASAPKSTLFASNTGTYDGTFYPVAINATSTGAQSVGVYGSGTYLGLWGDVTGTGAQSGSIAVYGGAGDGDGGYFINSSTSYAALYAENDGEGTTSTGVNPIGLDAVTNGDYGYTVFASGTGIDTFSVFGDSVGNGGVGVYGEADGNADASNNPPVGVLGWASGGLGVLGYTVGNSQTYNGFIDQTSQLTGGVWGDTSAASGGTVAGGVVGTADNNSAGYFANNSSGSPTIWANNSSGATGLFKTFKASTPAGTCGIGDGDLTCTGQMKTLATTSGGAHTVETYAMQSPENWMEDFGSGELQKGVAVVTIDAAFADTVTGDASYHVFITPNGDSKGLYVINKTSNSFEVRESSGGTSSLSFDYRIVAKRRGYEAQRLTDVTERFKVEQAELQRRMPTATIARAARNEQGKATVEARRNAAQRLARPHARPGAGKAAAIRPVAARPVAAQGRP
jgi:hypothetical protein